ncbi:MAG: prolyl oligopeptidase family serine peptidase, partial [Thermoguttaceae bacterium]|nr:prolyl oligopeptidase family serine peptidase [Thermoguttaceae bacterium]
WSLLAHCPEKIAAAAPICGGGDPNAATKMATTPIWAFHGDKDNLVPLGMSKAMIEANQKAGNPEAKLTVYEGVGHDSWTNAYADEELYKWLLSKRLSGKPTKVEPVAVDETPKAGELVAASIELPAVVRARGAADKLDESKTQTLKYYVFQPSDESAKTDAGFPLMLMLHGSGERGDDLNKLKVYGPAMYCSKAESAKDWKFFTVAPQCPSGVGWSAPQLSVMIDKLCEKYPIDKSRVYVTGVSMGGYGTWNLLAECPEKIAAAAPICGGGNVDAAAKMASTPIWAFHGDQDKAVPLGASQRMIDAVKAAGNEEAKLTIYPGVGHNSWINAYAEADLYTWLLSKTKAQAK